jgi:hypothetical protein
MPLKVKIRFSIHDGEYHRALIVELKSSSKRSSPHRLMTAFDITAKLIMLSVIGSMDASIGDKFYHFCFIFYITYTNIHTLLEKDERIK